MRKRKREYGTFVDEDTGEVSKVQSTKQAKRNHQKFGKWYKEPTEKEIRAWDREEQRQKAADKAARREDNKKINATKRAEKQAKQDELKRSLFEAGKISFTQTLAKKDEDQLNLHSWFGRRPQPKRKEQSENKSDGSGFKHELPNKEYELRDGTADGLAECEEAAQLSQGSSPDGKSEEDVNTASCQVSDNTAADIPKDVCRSALLLQDYDPMDSSQDFDIAEDSDTETDILDLDIRPLQQHDDVSFKVPPLPILPRRPPLSPMSKSDLNIRASQIAQTSSFNNKLGKADISIPPSTQAVRDLLSGICTQDLNDDLDEGMESEDKENEGPYSSSTCSKSGSPVAKNKSASPLKHPIPAKHTQSPEENNKSFITVSDSCDYDSIFAELDATTTIDNAEDFDDNGLDDATLLSLPATQLISSGKPTAHLTKKPFKKIDSFAVEGLDDEDLEQALEEFERSQRKLATPSTATPASVAGSTFRKKKRVLPWDRADWTVQEAARHIDEELEQHTQYTEAPLSSA